MVVQSCHFVPGKNVNTVYQKDLPNGQDCEECHHDGSIDDKSSGSWIWNSPLWNTLFKIHILNLWSLTQRSIQGHIHDEMEIDDIVENPGKTDLRD